MKGVGSEIPSYIYVGSIIFCLILLISITTHQVYADSLIGSGINLKINGNSASGTLILLGQHYKAPNLNIVIKKDQITLTGNIIGTYQGLLMTTGIHTKGIEYKFNGVISQNGKNVPTTFIVLFTNDAKKPVPTITTVKQSVTIMNNEKTGLPMLMLTTHNDKVYMTYTYNFVVKIFDPKSNPQKIFDQFYGGISDVNIITTILEPNNKIIGQSIGKTDSKGIYQDGIGIPYTQYSQEQVQVMINATKKGYATQLATLPLLLIHPNSGSAPVCSIATSSLPSGIHNVAYSQTLSSSSCNSPVTWSIASGLPTGLSLDTSTGIISGTPTVAGTYTFVVTATSSDGKVATTSLSITIS